LFIGLPEVELEVSTLGYKVLAIALDRNPENTPTVALEAALQP
jgi:hypothetical protein